MEDVPSGWTVSEVKQDFTITLFAFSWALLPVGFMAVLSVTTRYEGHRLTLAAVASLMLALAFASGAGQRRSSLLEPRMQLAAAVLATAAGSIALIWGLELTDWWWVSYGFVFGAVACMYVGLNHLSSCDSPSLSLPWPATHPVPVEALEEWNISNGRWANGRMGSRRFDDGSIATMYGALEGEQTRLCFEVLSPSKMRPSTDAWGVDFTRLHDASGASFAEE